MLSHRLSPLVLAFLLPVFLFPGLAFAAWAPEDLLALRFVDGPSLSPDGRAVVFQVTEAVTGPTQSELRTQLWLAPGDGSPAFALTHGEHGSFAPAWSPDGSSIAFLSDRDGEADLYLLPVGGGEAKRLTRLPDGVAGFKWGPKGGEIAFLAREPASAAREAAEKALDDPQVVGAEPRYRHLWRVAAELAGSRLPEARRVTSGSFEVNTFAWSPDGSRFVITRHPRPEIFQWRNSDLYLVPAAGGEPTPLVTDAGMDTGGIFSPDGKTIAFVSDRGNRVWARDWRICLIPAAGGPVTVLPRTFDSMPGENINGELLAWAKDGSGVYYAETNKTSIDLFFAPADGSAYRQITTIPGFKAGLTLSADRSTVAFGQEDFTTPPEIYIQSLTGGEARKRTDLNHALAARQHGGSQIVHWQGPGGEIEGIYHPPQTSTPGKRPPLLVSLHGGPTSAFFRNYTASLYNPTQVFTAQGYAVLEVNPRGSAGYGRDFRLANLGDWGGGDVADVLAGLDYAVAQGWGDPKRVGVFGASYGGFLTGMTIAKASPRFAAAIVSAGPTDLVSMAWTTDIDGFPNSFLQSEPWEKPTLWADRSSVLHAHEIKTPTLILHGENDTRVPLSQGRELYRALQHAGTPTQLVVYPRSGHGVNEPKLALDTVKRQLAWFDQYLKQP